MQERSAIKRFPDAPGAAVNAETVNADNKTTIAASAMEAMTRRAFFFIDIPIPFLTYDTRGLTVVRPCVVTCLSFWFCADSAYTYYLSIPHLTLIRNKYAINYQNKRMNENNETYV